MDKWIEIRAAELITDGYKMETPIEAQKLYEQALAEAVEKGREELNKRLLEVAEKKLNKNIALHEAGYEQGKRHGREEVFQRIEAAVDEYLGLKILLANEKIWNDWKYSIESLGPQRNYKIIRGKTFCQALEVLENGK